MKATIDSARAMFCFTFCSFGCGFGPGRRLGRLPGLLPPRPAGHTRFRPKRRLFWGEAPFLSSSGRGKAPQTKTS
jgi:hypothetical protein